MALCPNLLHAGTREEFNDMNEEGRPSKTTPIGGVSQSDAAKNRTIHYIILIASVSKGTIQHFSPSSKR